MVKVRRSWYCLSIARTGWLAVAEYYIYVTVRKIYTQRNPLTIEKRSVFSNYLRIINAFLESAGAELHLESDLIKYLYREHGFWCNLKMDR